MYIIDWIGYNLDHIRQTDRQKDRGRRSRDDDRSDVIGRRRHWHSSIYSLFFSRPFLFIPAWWFFVFFFNIDWNVAGMGVCVCVCVCECVSVYSFSWCRKIDDFRDTHTHTPAPAEPTNWFLWLSNYFFFDYFHSIELFKFNCFRIEMELFRLLIIRQLIHWSWWVTFFNWIKAG